MRHKTMNSRSRPRRQGLANASRPQIVRLDDGDRFDLRITPVRKRINDAAVRMLAYNGSIPGPTLRVQQARR
jgi:hypothetical protein